MRRRQTRIPLLAIPLFASVPLAHAQNPDPMDIRACTAIESDAERLACYDHATGRERLPIAQKQAPPPKAPPDDVFASEHETAAAVDADAVAAPMSLLDSRWELAPEAKLGTYNVRGYRPVYLLPLFATSNQNDRPASPNALNTVRNPQHLDNVEAKFQLSLKTKIWQGVFGDAGDLWLAYTQASHWQVYNAGQSRPFRETDYEPEAMLVFDTHYEVLGWDGRLLGIGIDHQSNGRSNPLSRSWNRVVGQVGFERNNWTVIVRPWWRVPENGRDDNNPDISDYMGRGSVQIVHEAGAQEYAVLLRHSFRGGSRSHGAVKLTWSFPLAGNLRGYLEVFKGYGESLIDYNHNATYLGLGVSLLDWY